MPQLSAITLNDGATDYAFSPRGIDPNGVAALVQSSGVPIGDKRLTIQRSRTAAGREKVSIKMALPVVATETVNGVSRPSIVRTAYADLSFSFDGTSTTAERVLSRALAKDFLDDAVAGAIIDTLETLY